MGRAGSDDEANGSELCEVTVAGEKRRGTARE
jgi:hypothetical protein